MKCKRLNEVLELLQPYWSKDPDLSLLQILQKIADEAGFDKPVAELSDEVIIYHLKMHGTDKLEPIPGIKKDYEMCIRDRQYRLAICLHEQGGH